MDDGRLGRMGEAHPRCRGYHGRYWPRARSGKGKAPGLLAVFELSKAFFTGEWATGGEINPVCNRARALILWLGKLSTSGGSAAPLSFEVGDHMQAKTVRNKDVTHPGLSLIISLLLAFAAVSAKAQAFRHPGVLVSKEQLDFVKQKIAAGEEPWKSAFGRMKGSSYASLTSSASPRASVDCGAYSSPNNGCSEELNDAWTAYTNALLWAYTGNKAYADHAIKIMNAWSAVLKTHTNHNAPLQSGWAASISVRAAEIIKHTYDGWAPADAARYGDMLRKAYLPYVTLPLANTNGNWLLTMADAALDIGVFLDDRAVFDSAVARWRAHTVAYIYVTDDGPQPIPAPGQTKSMADEWYGQKTYKDGVAQETCRDLGHTEYALGSIGSAAETALLQGLDLYAEQAKRIVAGFEFHANFHVGGAVPSWLCGGKLNMRQMPTYEIVYNHFVNRRGLEMPFTKKLLEKLRPLGVDKHMAWETMTHANTGMVGIVTSVVRPSAGFSPSHRASSRLVFDARGKLVVSRPGPDGKDLFFALDGAKISQ
jgi:hypothetical protein